MTSTGSTSGSSFSLPSSSLLLGGAATATLASLALYMGKQYFNGARFTNPHNTDLSDQVAIVTGANAGIGKETALALAKMGAQVILACRDTQKASDAKKYIIQHIGEDAAHRVYIYEVNAFILASTLF
jgi:3-oxoacyl-ACP reductase-like protein